MPLTLVVFAVAGIALMGLPPSGAYVAKKLFFDAAATTGQAWLGIVLDAGAFLTASYTVLVLAHALRPATSPLKLQAPPSRAGEIAALALAIAALLLGFAATGRIPQASLSGAFTPDGPRVRADLDCGRRRDRRRTWHAASPLRQRHTRGHPAAAAAGHGGRGGLVVRVDGALRHWSIATLTLLALAFALAAAIAAGA